MPIDGKITVDFDIVTELRYIKKKNYNYSNYILCVYILIYKLYSLYYKKTLIYIYTIAFFYIF